MAITPGTWSIAGINIPDFGWTEKNAPQLGVNPQQPPPSIEGAFGADYTGPTGSLPKVVVGSGAPYQETKINPPQIYPSVSGSTNNEPATQNTSSGPTGDSRLTQLEKTNRNPVQEEEYQRLLNELRGQANQGPSEAELNSLYDPAMGYLNQAESVLRGQLPSTMSLLEQQAGTSRQMLGDQRASAFGQLGEQGTQATQRKEDAISASRRLFNELQMANQQRFGGASSAGQAASELQGRELMQNRAGINRDFGTAMRQIEMSKADVENQFQTGIRQIEDRKQQAINEVNQDFQSKLLEINSQRASTEQAKASARLEILQQARDRVFQINLQDFNFKQQLAAQKQAADAQISQYSQALQTQVGAGQSATGQFLANTKPNATTNFAVGGGSQTMESPIYRGQMGEDEMKRQGIINTARGYDDYNNPVYNTLNMSTGPIQNQRGVYDPYSGSQIGSSETVNIGRY